MPIYVSEPTYRPGLGVALRISLKILWSALAGKLFHGRMGSLRCLPSYESADAWEISRRLGEVSDDLYSAYDDDIDKAFDFAYTKIAESGDPMGLIVTAITDSHHRSRAMTMQAILERFYTEANKYYDRETGDLPALGSPRFCPSCHQSNDATGS